jgi:hypothetical protein
MHDVHDLQSGSLVQHASLGLGRIVAVEPDAVHVFFPGYDKRFAAKLRLPTARPMLRTDGFEPDAWLGGLSAFSLDPTTGRYALAATWLTHEQAVAMFRAVHPHGFAGPDGARKGKEARRLRWRAARELWTRSTGNGEAERLLAEGDVEALVRLALRVEAVLAPLLPDEAGAVAAALAEPGSARSYFIALVQLLSVPSPSRARFEKLFAAARALPVEPAWQWLMATLFPFVAQPGRNVLLRPRTTCQAADRLGSDLRYQPAPAWPTYAALRGLQVRLLERLAPEGAEDFADVEAFLHVVATGRRTPAGAAGPGRGHAGARRPRAEGRARR